MVLALARSIWQFDEWMEGAQGADVFILDAETNDFVSLFYDEQKAEPAPNPFKLDVLVTNGCQYGKAIQPVYTDAEAYYWTLQGLATSGIHRHPLLALGGVDASNATIRVPGSTALVPLGQAVGRTVDASYFGTLINQETANNTAIIAAALGYAAGLGGARVRVPAGQWVVDKFTIPANVVLAGDGITATTLVSQIGGPFCDIVGNNAGLERIKIDGLNLVANSVGVNATGISYISLRDVEVTRFSTGLRLRGVEHALLDNARIDNCANGALVESSSDNGPAGPFEWRGGRMTSCTSLGLRLRALDGATRASNLLVQGVEFTANLGVACRIVGGRQVTIDNCLFDTNIFHLLVEDYTAVAPQVPSISVAVRASRFLDGKITVEDTAQALTFEHCHFEQHTWDINSPLNPFILWDCVEASVVAISGDGSKILRRQRLTQGKATLVTTNAIKTPAWRLALTHGQVAAGIARFACNGLNTIRYGGWVVHFLAARDPASLPFIDQSGNFMLGEVVKGDISDATGTLIAQTDTGTAGTLKLRQVSGAFVINEFIRGQSSGSRATAQSALIVGAVMLIEQTRQTTFERPDSETEITMDGSGAELQGLVTGVSGEIIEWQVEIDLALTT